MKILFICSIFFVAYAYLGYPISLFLFGLVHKKTVKKLEYFPVISLIITVHNEEIRIREKLNNTFLISYPKDKFEILVVSDGSTDDTNKIILEYQESGVTLIPVSERKGKENAQKYAVERAKGDILIFSDVATLLEPGSLKQIVSNFADPSVGCVSGEDRVIHHGGNLSGEGLYVQYEMMLRRLETKVHSLVGLSGSFFAARKEVCRDFSGELQSDFRTVMNSMRMGLRAISDPEALGYYKDISSSTREFDRKVRTVLRGLTVFFRNLEFLNIARYGFYSYQYFCHKLLRWLVPVFLIAIFISNIFIMDLNRVYLLLFVLQLVFYGYGIFRNIKISKSLSLIGKIPVYFITVNTSILLAWWKYLKGERIVMWKPSER